MAPHNSARSTPGQIGYTGSHADKNGQGHGHRTVLLKPELGRSPFYVLSAAISQQDLLLHGEYTVTKCQSYVTLPFEKEKDEQKV